MMREAGPSAVKTRNCRPQFGQTQRGRIEQVAGFYDAYAGVTNRLCGRKVRLADLHVYDGAAVRFKLACPRQQLHHMEWSNLGDTLRNWWGGIFQTVQLAC